MVLCGLNPAVGDIFYTTQMLNPKGSAQTPFQIEPDVTAAIGRLNRDAVDK